MIFVVSGGEVSIQSAHAYYSVNDDYVQMPPFACFRDAGSYYATLLHELTHWTRHASRLAREFGRKRWGDAGYAAEELVAELGSAFLCADLGVTAEPRDEAELASLLALHLVMQMRCACVPRQLTGSQLSCAADEGVRPAELYQLVRRELVGAFPEIGH